MQHFHAHALFWLLICSKSCMCVHELYVCAFVFLCKMVMEHLNCCYTCYFLPHHYHQLLVFGSFAFLKYVLLYIREFTINKERERERESERIYFYLLLSCNALTNTHKDFEKIKIYALLLLSLAKKKKKTKTTRKNLVIIVIAVIITHTY